MDATPTPLHSDAPLGARRAIIRRNPDDMQEVEMVEATWGSNPRFSAGVAFRFVRAEGQTFPSYRCLIPAPKFHIRSGERTFRVTFDGGNFFYLAAIWRRSGGDLGAGHGRLAAVLPCGDCRGEDINEAIQGVGW